MNTHMESGEPTPTPAGAGELGAGESMSATTGVQPWLDMSTETGRRAYESGVAHAREIVESVLGRVRIEHWFYNMLEGSAYEYSVEFFDVIKRQYLGRIKIGENHSAGDGTFRFQFYSDDCIREQAFRILERRRKA